ncbi:MAG: hypothetical protein QM726_23955 [Chitinophagaceae bacterium]
MSSNKFVQVWGKPFLLFVITIFGLLAALLGTGVWHWLSWIALCIPPIVLYRFIFMKKKTTKP